MTRSVFSPTVAAIAALAGLLGAARPAIAQLGEIPPQTSPSTISTPPPEKSVPMPIFFPPVPPPLDALAPTGRRDSGAQPNARVLAAGELTGYVGEIFYPGLAARLGRDSLTPRLRQQVEQYRAETEALRQELRTLLDRLRGVPPAERLRSLGELARRQAPRLAELEKNAEELRRDLIQLDHGWDDLREWHLLGGEAVHTPRVKAPVGMRTVNLAFTPHEIAEVMLGAAFYFPNLLPAQRGLLREIALELTLAAANTSTSSLAQPHVFFSPELARIPSLDDHNLPANVAEKFSRHQAQKTRLKKELYDAIHNLDRPGLNFGRNRRLKTLADQQAPLLASLEALAEELRREMAVMAGQAPETSALPPTLVGRIVAANQAQAAARGEALEKIRRIAARTQDFEIAYRFEPTGLRVEAIPIKYPQPPGVKRTEAVESAVQEIVAAYGQQLTEQRPETIAIREAVAQAIGSNTPAAIDAALRDGMRIAVIQGPAGLEYRAAVFEPGLSVEQRRLLFAGVVERLGLPLPAGVLQPTTREAWR